MNCPRDATILEVHHINQTSFYQCPKCQGIWVGKSCLDRLKTYQFDDERALDIREKENFSNGILAPPFCPVDSSLLTIEEFNGVYIDSCSICGGKWLDGGELQLICRNYRQGEELKEELEATAVFEVVCHFLASL